MFWWTAYYYYGALSPESKNYDPTLKNKLFQLSRLDDSGKRGFLCSTPLDETGIYIPDTVRKLLEATPPYRVLNYSYEACLKALWSVGNHGIQLVGNPPVGLSQRVRLSQENDNQQMDDDTMEDIFDFSSGENNTARVTHDEHPRSRLSREWYECMEALNNSPESLVLQDKVRALLLDITCQARSTSSSRIDLVGNRVSMLPESAVARQTHGT